MKTKQKQLKLQDKGINILYNRNVLGSHTPQSLLNTLIWLNNSVQFEHQTLRLLRIFYYKKVKRSHIPAIASSHFKIIDNYLYSEFFMTPQNIYIICFNHLE